MKNKFRYSQVERRWFLIPTFGGSNPSTGICFLYEMAEWFKAVDCKSIVNNIVGSNPALFTFDIFYFVNIFRYP